MTNSNEKLFLPVVVQQTKEEQTESQTVEQESKMAKTLQIEAVFILVQKDARFPLKQSQEKILLRMYIPSETEPVSALFSGKAFIDFRAFATEVGKYFTCLDSCFYRRQFSKIVHKLHYKTPRKNIYACGGYQFDLYVWKNAIFDIKRSKVVFLQKTEQTKNFDNIENTLINIENNCRPELAMSGKNPIDVAVNFFTNLRDCYNDPKTLLCFGSALAVVFWDIFQETNKGFPVIFFLGETHSGKSTLMYCLSSIYGIADNNIMSGTSTSFAIIKELGDRMGIPLFIEELGQNFFVKMAEQLVKIVYGAIPRERGTKTGVEKLPTFTTFVATSNYGFIQPSEALLSRTLFVRMKKTKFKQNEFLYFAESSRKDLSLILPLLIRYRDSVLPVYKKVFTRLTMLISDYSGDRYLKSVAIGCTMWILINHILGDELFDWQKMAIEYCNSYEKCLQSRVTNADMMMRHIAKLIDDEKLIYGVHYKLVHDVILRLNLRKFVEKFNILYGNAEEQILTMSEFCHSVENDNRFDTERKTMDIGKTISINIANEEYLLEKINSFKLKQPFKGRYEDESEI